MVKKKEKKKNLWQGSYDVSVFDLLGNSPPEVLSELEKPEPVREL